MLSDKGSFRLAGVDILIKDIDTAIIYGVLYTNMEERRVGSNKQQQEQQQKRCSKRTRKRS